MSKYTVVKNLNILQICTKALEKLLQMPQYNVHYNYHLFKKDLKIYL